MTGYDIVRSDRAFRFLVDLYQGEFPSRLHRRTGKKGAGVVTGDFRRILEDHFIIWVQAYDPETGAPLWLNPEETDPKKRRPKNTHSRPVNQDDPDEWKMPGHEAVKRLDKDKDAYRWLRAVLVWRGAQCFCSHASIVEHVAAVNEVHIHDVIDAVLRASRICVSAIERTGALPDVPTPVRVSATPPRRLSRLRAGRVDMLARTYDP